MKQEQKATRDVTLTPLVPIGPREDFVPRPPILPMGAIVSFLFCLILIPHLVLYFGGGREFYQFHTIAAIDFLFSFHFLSTSYLLYLYLIS